MFFPMVKNVFWFVERAGNMGYCNLRLNCEEKCIKKVKVILSSFDNKTMAINKHNGRNGYGKLNRNNWDN